MFNPDRMKRGFPRPRIESAAHRYPDTEGKIYPIPYSSETHNIATLHPGRHHECLTFNKCLVCGIQVKGDGPFHVILSNGELFQESGPFHEKCIELTMRMCPEMNKKMDKVGSAKNTYQYTQSTIDDIREIFRHLNW